MKSQSQERRAFAKMEKMLPLLELVGFLGFLPRIVHAQIVPSLIPQDGQIAGCSFVTGEFHFHCLPLYLAYLIQLVFSFLATICLIMIIWAGYQIAIGGITGDKEAGKKRLTAAIVGLVVSVLSFLIVNTIISALTGG